MMLICSVAVVAGMFVSKADVEGKMLSQSKEKYYVDFSEDLKKNEWKLFNGNNGKILVNKSDCVEKP